MTSRTASALVCALCISFGTTAAARAQDAAPLHKGDLVRFLTGTTYSKPEIAAIIRRACLAFSPTTRDFQNLRDLGATTSIVGAMRECTANNNRAARAATAAPAPVRPVEIDLPYRRVSAPAGAVAQLTVTVHRGDTPLSGVRLMLHGSRAIPNGANVDLGANTDRDGHATFSIPAGTVAGSYQLKVADLDAAEVRGATDVVLTTLPAAPSQARVTPPALTIGAGARGARELSVLVADAFANPVPRLEVQLRPSPARGAAGPLTQSTNDAGVAQFSVPTTSLRAGDSLVVAAGDRSLATVHVTAGAQMTTLLLDAERQLTEGRTSAEPAYDSVLSVDPNNSSALLGRGYARTALGKYDQATQDFQAALRGSDSRADGLTGLGYVALRQGDLATAAKQFQDALAADSGDAAASTGLAYAELWRIDPRQAPHRTAALASPRPTAYPAAAAEQLRAGISFFAAHNLTAADRALSSAASAAPAWADVFYTRALVRQAQGHASLAIADFERYLQLRPTASDRSAVASRIDALGRSPSAALAYGVLPGGGQFYTKQPVLGAVVLGGVAGGVVWGLRKTQERSIFVDPFGRPDTTFVSVAKHRNAGFAVAGALWAVGAIEAMIHASSARGDPYPPAQAPAAKRSASLPTLSPYVGVDQAGPRWGAALAFAFR
jgi:tetratricopeptide (TPR) repeat protein